jgi:hypothetical protein
MPEVTCASFGSRANGQALAFVYCEDEPGRRATGKLLTRDEARRIAASPRAAVALFMVAH